MIHPTPVLLTGSGKAVLQRLINRNLYLILHMVPLEVLMGRHSLFYGIPGGC